jgi:hypothetical protein
MDLQIPGFRDEQEVRRENVDEAIRGQEGHSRLIGDYIQISGTNMPSLEGVGLVVGLDGTGDDPPASHLRNRLLDDMRRRNVENPNQWLRRASTTIVLVRAYIPPLIRKGDSFDVQVYLPPGSQATSLAGGKLLECDLTEKAVIAGQGVFEGKRLAVAGGHILLEGGEEAGNGTMLRGRIPSGALYLGEDRNLRVYLRPDYRSVRMSQRIAARIGQRFHDYDEYGIKRPLAEAKTDFRIELIVHNRYRDNWPRYLQCIRHIRLRESAMERQLRLQRLRRELAAEATAGTAALELEAIGVDAVPILKQALSSALLEVRFHAAVALAYLGHSEGAAVLREAADQEAAFRIHALAALAALRTPEAALELRKLLDHPGMETRYGAVRALSTLDPHDPAIRGEEFEQGFTLRVVETTGEPMVHVTRRMMAEAVVFGPDQEFLTPMVVSAGSRFMLRTEAGQDAVTIAKFAPGQDVEHRVVSKRVADVIRALAEMEANYSDILQMLTEAERQHNLPGVIGIDELPRPGRVYYRQQPQVAEGGQDAPLPVESGDLAPNLFVDEMEEPADVQAAPQDQQAAAGQPDLGPVGFGVQ